MDTSLPFVTERNGVAQRRRCAGYMPFLGTETKIVGATYLPPAMFAGSAGMALLTKRFESIVGGVVLAALLSVCERPINGDHSVSRCNQGLQGQADAIVAMGRYPYLAMPLQQAPKLVDSQARQEPDDYWHPAILVSKTRPSS